MACQPSAGKGLGWHLIRNSGRCRRPYDRLPYAVYLCAETLQDTEWPFSQAPEENLQQGAVNEE